MRTSGLILALGIGTVFFWVSSSQAACTWDGQQWNCRDGSTSAEVQAAINSAEDGATIVFAPGHYSWAGIRLRDNIGVTLKATTAGACTVKVEPSFATISLEAAIETNTKLYRISGFVFANAQSGYTIAFYSWSNPNPVCMTNIRIDHNTFLNFGPRAAAILLGENSHLGAYYGVIDHNTAISANNHVFVMSIGGTWPAPAESSYRGAANNMYIEDNTLTFTSMVSDAGCIDCWGGAAVVYRHNNSKNCLVASHGVVHAGGPWNLEAYNNSLVVDSGAVGWGFGDGYRLIHHQGSGEFIAFNNSFTSYSGHSTVPISMLHYRSWKPTDGGYLASIGRCDGTNPLDGNRPGMMGYPCWRQPGRDGYAKLQPMYVWNNTWIDTHAKVNMAVEGGTSGEPPYVSTHIANDRDYYNAVSKDVQTSPAYPFNGTTGMGFGTLANRPTTCTTNPNESGGGVGYFATDVGPQGTLYRCSETNTWVAHYTPYTYPHPLTQEENSGIQAHRGNPVEVAAPLIAKNGQTITLYNLKGQAVCQLKGEFNKVLEMADIERGLPNGIYLWRTSGKGAQQSVRRVVVR